MNYGLRVQKILGSMQQDGIDSLLVTQGTDIRYVSGFSGEAGVAVIILSESRNYLITDDGLPVRRNRRQKDLRLS